MQEKHLQIKDLTYSRDVRTWLSERYGKEKGENIWTDVVDKYNEYLKDLPDYGGKKNGHAYAIYGALLVFALYPSLPDKPPISELQSFVQSMFMGAFTKLGKIFDLNRNPDMRLIDMVFKRAGKKDQKDIKKYPTGFINITEPYDREQHAARYYFTQCPNAEFAKSHDLLHVLPLLCNSDFFGISEIHGKLIRCGTCGNSDRCDYMVVGDRNPITDLYVTEVDENGFMVSKKK